MEKLIPFLSVNLFLLVFYLIYVLFLKNETFHQINRLYLIITTAISVAVPFINYSTIKSWFITEQVQQLVYTTQLPEFVVSTSTPDHLNWVLILSILHWTITILLILRFAINISRAFLVTFSASFLEKNAFSFFGIIKIDKSLPYFSTILSHERVHTQQLHFLDLLYFEILKCIFWSNPVVYFYKKSISELHEYLADEVASLTLSSKADYATLLVSKSFKAQPDLLMVQPFNKSSTLKKRIVMLSKNNSGKISLLKYWVVMPLAFILMVSNAISCKKAENEAEVAQQEKNEEAFKTENGIREKDLEDAKSALKEDGHELTISKEQLPSKIAEIRNKLKNNSDDKIYGVVQTQPEFKGGIKELYKYLGENIKYPNAAQRANVSGKVFVKFVVEKDGSIENVEVLKGMGFGCDEESIRVIKSMPNWQPGMENGKAVRTYFQIPISYKLD